MANENGNGEVQVETSWMSKHVRPVLAVLGFLLYNLLVAAILLKTVAVVELTWEIVVALIAPDILFPLWYINVRAGDKAMERLMAITGKILPKANGQTTTTTTVSANGSPVVVQPMSPSETIAPPVEADIPFDEKAFLDEVKKTVVVRYTVDNPSTTFYNAETAARFWEFNNTQAWRDCQKFVFKLAGEAFKSIWGVSYDDAVKYLNDPKGCSTCEWKGCTYPDLKYKSRQLGIGYYSALLDYERMRDATANY